MVHAFEEAFQDDAFGSVGDVFHCGYKFHAVFFECMLMDRRFIFVAGKPVKLVNCHIFLWTVLLVMCLLLYD